MSYLGTISIGLKYPKSDECFDNIYYVPSQIIRDEDVTQIQKTKLQEFSKRLIETSVYYNSGTDYVDMSKFRDYQSVAEELYVYIRDELRLRD